MLSENIKNIRESKGLSQEELAIKLNVVRQTVSKWERGLSVPDSEMLVVLSEELETPVSTLLGETVADTREYDVKQIAEKLEVVNLQLARRSAAWRKALRCASAGLGVATILVLVCLAALGSPYLTWDYGDPETAVAGTIYHAFEFVFVRAVPILLAASIAGFFLARQRQ